MVLQIADLWVSTNPNDWEDALDTYWNFVQPRNKALEKALDALDLERLRRMDARSWYDFLKDEYFVWKYTAPNRYATTSSKLRRYEDEDNLDRLDQIRRRLLRLDTSDIDLGFMAASTIHGLGTAGASGLLALMYPGDFGTVDQFVVKALRQVSNLPEATSLERMNPESLTIQDAVLLTGILRRKAADNNRAFGTDTWTPRKLDKVLWTYGR